MYNVFVIRKGFTKTYHIIFDAFGVNKSLLGDEKFVFDLLYEIPNLVKMKILTGPHLVRDYDKGHEGFTGFAILDFSHISIHTFVKTQEIYIDVFSCKKFDYDEIREFLYKKVKVNPSQIETLEVKYPWE